jgi:plastocyanin
LGQNEFFTDLSGLVRPSRCASLHIPRRETRPRSAVALGSSLTLAQEKPAAPPPPVTAEVGPDGVQHASITVDSYSFTPRHLIVQAGKLAELTLTSVTTLTPQNFILKEPASGLSVAQEVGPREIAKVIFTPTKPGIYVFYCDKKLPFFPSHREQGMEGRLEVRP